MTKSKMNVIALVVLSFSFVTETKGLALPMLQGNVSHSENLPELDPHICIGAQFDENMLPKPVQNDDWYQIPYWFAGKFAMSEKTIVSYYSYKTDTQTQPNRTIPYEFSSVHGCQIDSLNTVWDCSRVPHICRARGSNFIDIAYVYSQQAIEVNSDRVIFKSAGYGIRVSTGSNRIIRIFPQVDWLSTFYPDDEGHIKRELISIVYDRYGNAITRGVETSILTKTEPFHRVDMFNSKDLRESFRTYLISQGLANLVPSTVEIKYDQLSSLNLKSLY